MSSNNTMKFFLTGEDIYDEGRDSSYLAEKILSYEGLAELKDLTIGCFGEAYDESSQTLLDMIIANKDKFQQLESLFVGDMDYEECEVSWISQGNYSKLYDALPNLKTLKIKGSNDLTLGTISHQNLKHLEIICGGLPKDVIKEVANADLPNLETLILYIGVEEYGFDGSVEDLRPLTQKERFPKLRHLGLVDAEIQDEITALVLEATVLPQLEVLQLSYGSLTDKGGQLLLDHADQISHLKKLDLEYHFLSDQMVEKLKNLPMEVDVSDPQGADDDYQFPMLTE